MPKKEKAIHTRLFHDRSLVDAAVEVSKFGGMMDFRPRLLKDLGLSEADIARCPLRIQKDAMEETLKALPDREDSLFGQVPNRISDALLVTMWEASAAYTAKALPEFFREATKLGADRDSLTFMHNYLLTNVTMLNRQMSFLWYSFKEATPCIDVVTKEACELVNGTKLDANVTKEMLDSAFEKDRYVCLSVPVDGFKEIVCMRRGGRVSVLCGQITSGETVLNKRGYGNQPFSVIGSLNVDDLVGRMTRRNMTENGTEMQRLNDNASIRDVSEAVWGPEAPEHAEERYRISGEVVTDIVSFVLKLRILLGMEKTPVAQLRTQEGTYVSLDGVSTPPEKRGISYSVVSLTKEFRKARSEWRGDGEKLDRFGKDLVAKQIAGFIRRQHYGEGNKLSKFIYIAPFTNRFWVNSGVHITRIVK